MDRLLKHIINTDKRDYIIGINEALAKVIVFYAGKYDKPTHENVVHPNTHRLLDLEEEFFRCWDAKSAIYRALFRLVQVKYEHSPNWRNFLDWFLMKVENNWKPFNIHRQMPLWKGDNNG